ncbi:glycosyltransferase [Sorangium sp. So ce302]|uniref:glycosyltransferase n=1 Tax=Sorangium sp. So ce302 TaxID=3133297 RepID=UPI003F614AB9
MLCFAHDWTGDPLSKTHLMRGLSKDNRILWVSSIGYRAPKASGRDFRRILDKLKAFTEPVREVEPNLFVLNPLAIPAWGNPAMHAVNRELLKLQVRRATDRLGLRNVVNWVFTPTAAVIAGALGESFLIYYCVDEFTAFHDVPAELMDLERSLVEKVDLCIVSSEKLLRTKSQYNPRTALVRHGVQYEHFRTALAPKTKIPADIAALPKPVIGYFGLMADEWIDIPLMEAVARHFSGGSMVLLGKVTTDISRLTALPNVHVLGRKPFSELPAYCKGFDVAINPFPINEMTLNANPLKVREYLAAGLPVVSTRIPEVEVVKEARIGDTTEAFIELLEEELKLPGPRPERGASMRYESWEVRIEEVRRAVAATGRY